MATVQENIDSLSSAFSTHMKSKNPGFDTATETNIEDFSLAYATAIANAIGAYSDGGEVVLTDYIKKTGAADGIMSGKFTATSEFAAGYNYVVQLSTSATGISMATDVNQASGVFKGHGYEMFRHEDTWLKINSLGEFTDGVNLGGSLLKVDTALLVGADAASGFYADASELKYKGANIYHSANANSASIDWTTKNLYTNGAFIATGTAIIGSKLTAINDFQLGYGGDMLIGVNSNSNIEFYGESIFLPSGFALYNRTNDDYILKDHGNGAVTLSAAGSELHLGYQNTTKNILSASLYTYNGDKLIVDKFGAGTFNWGFQAGTEGESRLSVNDLGATIFGSLYLNDSSTVISEGDTDAARISTPNGYIDIGAIDETYLSFKTDRSAFYFDKAIMGYSKVGILGSTTRIEANKLLLSDSSYFYNASDGIKHYGHSYITGNIGTESYASGFSGYGWRITPEAEATFTDLTVRRKLKVYELEVQTITAINGSFWVSSNCSGETVIAL